MILKTENIKTITIFCNENNCSDKTNAFLRLAKSAASFKRIICLTLFNLQHDNLLLLYFKNFKTKSNIFLPSIEKVGISPKSKARGYGHMIVGFFFFFPIIVHISQSHPVNSSGSRMRLKGMTTDSNR